MNIAMTASELKAARRLLSQIAEPDERQIILGHVFRALEQLSRREEYDYLNLTEKQRNFFCSVLRSIGVDATILPAQGNGEIWVRVTLR